MEEILGELLSEHGTAKDSTTKEITCSRVLVLAPAGQYVSAN